MIFYTIVLLVVLLGILILPLLSQNSMIYYPRRYAPPAQPGAGPFADFRPYTATDGVEQWGLWIEPNPPQPESLRPDPHVYLVFYGNAALASEMGPTFQILANLTGCSFFIPDYRGYGFNEGKPTEGGLVAGALGAYDSLAADGLLDGGAGVLGHSMGGAVAFALADRRPVDKLVIISSFPSVVRVAQDLVPWPYPHLLWNRWPSDERLRRLVAHPPAERPEIVLMHGASDYVIDVKYGRELAEIGGDAVTWLEYPRAGHNDVFEFVWDDLVATLRGNTPAAPQSPR